jgi:hypothetical protein
MGIVVRAAYPSVIVTLVASLAFASAWAAAPPAPPAPQYPAWATWVQKDLIIKLDPLPKRYSCNALWYKFRDVLLAIGAKPGLSILVYPCDGKADLAAIDPNVHLQFFMPEVLPKATAGWAQFKAVPRKVELSPGHPSSLDGSDCNLLRQMKGALLDSLAQHVDHADLTCQPSKASTKSFSVELDALVSTES